MNMKENMLNIKLLVRILAEDVIWQNTWPVTPVMGKVRECVHF